MREFTRVLLIDDSEAQYYLIEGFLAQSKINRFQLDWGASYTEALQLIERNHYDICLLDYELGEHTGLDILRQFEERGITTPVIVLTGYGSQDIDIAVMKAGAVEYIDKAMLNAHLLERAIRYTVEQFRSVEALRQSELRFRAMVEKGSDLIIQLDGQGRFLYTSPSIKRILGYEENELLGQALLDYVHQDDLLTLGDMFNQLTTVPQSPPIGSYRIRSKQGIWQWFETIATNLLRIPGIHAIIVNARDVTERLRLLKLEQDQRAVAEALLETSNALNSTLKLEEVLSYILRRVERVVPFQSANVLLINPNNQTYAATYQGYEACGDVNQEDFCLEIDKILILRRMVETQQPVVIANVSQEICWPLRRPCQNSRSYVGVPLIEDDQVIGFVNLESSVPAFYAQPQAEVLRLFANQAVIALRNARAYQQAQDLAALEERQRLARELHDVVSQTLFSASFIADSLTRMMDGDREKLRVGLEKLTQLNRSALAEMRTLLVELRPQSVITTPLPELMRNLANSISGRSNILIDLEIIGEPVALNPDVHLQLYRLAQEILTNTHKHAQAQHIQMELRYLEHWIELAIADDGVGFDPEAVSSEHHGIEIMRERAAKIGASIGVESSPGEGTYVQVRWPFEQRMETGV